MSQIKPFVLALNIFILTRSVLAQDGQCALCVDGSEPDMSLMSADLGWSCSDLNTFAAILKEGDAECTELQIVGFQDCACRSYPGGFCTLCPGGFSDIPDKSVSVPSTTNLTCGDILFVEENLLQGGCNDLAPYRDRCGCPDDAVCSYCADGSMPMEGSRFLPYLSTPDEPLVTCSGVASSAFGATEDQCDLITVAPVAVNGQGYCGCQGTFPSSLCTLCPGGAEVVNPEVILPSTQGMTCSELEEYIRYVTDEESCLAIADQSQICCNAVEPCPVCSGSFEADKLYEPYSLSCSQIGNAQDFGRPMTCDDVQTRFPFFCGCGGAMPACTLCQLGELPPDTNKAIPLLSTTCKEVNDYASIRLMEECSDEIASLSFDASSYCGCTGFDPPMQCRFCPDGQEVTNPSAIPVQSAGATCGYLEDFADYVRTANLCSAVQAFAIECCRDPTAPTSAPTVALPAVTLPTQSPSPTGANSTSAPLVSTDSPTAGFFTAVPIPQPSGATTFSVVSLSAACILATLAATMGS